MRYVGHALSFSSQSNFAHSTELASGTFVYIAIAAVRMSTFCGLMKEYRLVSLDRFDGINLESTVYMLSHCHSGKNAGRHWMCCVKGWSSLIVNYCKPLTNVFTEFFRPRLLAGRLGKFARRPGGSLFARPFANNNSPGDRWVGRICSTRHPVWL